MISSPHLYPQLCFPGGYKLWNHSSQFRSSLALCSCLLVLFLFSHKFILVLLLMLFNLLLNIYCVSIAVCSWVYAVLSDLPHPVLYLKESLSLFIFVSVDHSITLETCRQAVTELHNSLRQTVKLYTTVSECVCVCVREKRMRNVCLSAFLSPSPPVCFSHVCLH